MINPLSIQLHWTYLIYNSYAEALIDLSRYTNLAQSAKYTKKRTKFNITISHMRKTPRGDLSLYFSI